MAAWIPFTFERIFPKAIEEAVSSASSAISAVASVMIAIGRVVEIVGLLLMGFVDLLAAALMALVQGFRNLINDLLSMGFYVLLNFPGASNQFRFGEWKWQQFPGPREWINSTIASFDDQLDSERPQFSDDAYVAGLTLMIGFPSGKELFDWVEDFLAWLLNWSPVFNLNPVPKKEEVAHGDGRYPNWMSWTLRDLLKGSLDVFMDILDDLLFVIDDIASLMMQFGQFIQKKGTQLKQLVESLAAILIALLNALKKTGLWALPIFGQGGNTLLKSALQNVTGVPSEVQNSTQTMMNEVNTTITETIAKTGGSDPSKKTQERTQDVNTKLNAMNQAMSGGRSSTTDGYLTAATYRILEEKAKSEQRDYAVNIQILAQMPEPVYTVFGRLGVGYLAMTLTTDEARTLVTRSKQSALDGVPPKVKLYPYSIRGAKEYVENTLTKDERDTLAQVQKEEANGAPESEILSAPDSSAATQDQGVSGSIADTIGQAVGGQAVGGPADSQAAGSGPFEPTTFPDFGVDAKVFGLMLATGGPSEQVAITFMTLFGITSDQYNPGSVSVVNAAADTAEVVYSQATDQAVQSTAGVINNYGSKKQKAGQAKLAAAGV